MLLIFSHKISTYIPRTTQKPAPRGKMVFTGTPIEWIVTIFAVVGLIKLVVIMVNKKSWWNLTKGVYGNPRVFGIVFLVLAAIVLFYLLQELTIVQIIAAGVFMVLLMGFAFMTYAKELMALAKKIIYEKKFSGWMWLYIIIWVVLLVWVLYEIFLV